MRIQIFDKNPLIETMVAKEPYNIVRVLEIRRKSRRQKEMCGGVHAVIE